MRVVTREQPYAVSVKSAQWKLPTPCTLSAERPLLPDPLPSKALPGFAAVPGVAELVREFTAPGNVEVGDAAGVVPVVASAAAGMVLVLAAVETAFEAAAGLAGGAGVPLPALAGDVGVVGFFAALAGGCGTAGVGFAGCAGGFAAGLAGGGVVLAGGGGVVVGVWVVV